MNPILKLAQELKNAEGVSIAAIIKQIEALKKVDSMTAKELEKLANALVMLKKVVDDIPLNEEVAKLQEAISAATERVTTSLESKIAATKAELTDNLKNTETRLRKEIEDRIPDIITVTEKVTEVAKALDDTEIRKVLDKAIEPEFVKKVRDVIESFEGEERMDATKLKNLPQMQVIAPAGGGSNLSVFSNGTFVSSSTRLNFVGATVTDEGGRTKVTITGGVGGGQVDTVVGGTGVDVDATDPANPIVNLDAATIASLALADTASQPGHTHVISDITSLQTTLDGKQAVPVVVSGNLTAANDTRYVNVASATYTDPTPVEGKGFIVFVRNGTATVGGTAYATAGTIIHRVYHSGAWANYVYSTNSTLISDTAYGAGWNADTTTAPSKNAVYDEMELRAPKASPTFTGTVTLPTSLTGVLRADSGVVSTDTDVTDLVSAASDTVAGKVELAIASEVTTGTDATRAITPDALAGSEPGKRTIAVLVSGSASGDTALATGDGLVAIPVDTTLNGMNLVAVKAYVTTVSSSGAPLFQVRRSRRSSATARTVVDMLSIGVSIDANEFESADAATAAVINTSNDDVQTGDILLIDCDTAGTGTKGAQVLLTFQTP